MMLARSNSCSASSPAAARRASSIPARGRIPRSGLAGRLIARGRARRLRRGGLRPGLDGASVIPRDTWRATIAAHASRPRSKAGRRRSDRRRRARSRRAGHSRRPSASRRQLRRLARGRAQLAHPRLEGARPLLGRLSQVVALRCFLDQAGQRVERRRRALRLELGGGLGEARGDRRVLGRWRRWRRDGRLRGRGRRDRRRRVGVAVDALDGGSGALAVGSVVPGTPGVAGASCADFGSARNRAETWRQTNSAAKPKSSATTAAMPRKASGSSGRSSGRDLRRRGRRRGRRPQRRRLQRQLGRRSGGGQGAAAPRRAAIRWAGAPPARHR